MNTEHSYNLIRDPLYYVTLIFFVIVTTVPAAILSQSLFMPVSQAVSLVIFTALAVRRGDMRQALIIVGVWLALQFILLAALTWLLPTRLDHAFANGFNLRTATLQGFYTGQNLPRTLGVAPLSGLVEVAGVTLGSLATGGLIGAFFLVRAVNFAAFGMGGLLAAKISNLAALPLWTLIKLAGYAGFFVLLSRPVLTGNFSPSAIVGPNRRLLIISAALLVVGLLLELVLPGLWSGWFAP